MEEEVRCSEPVSAFTEIKIRQVDLRLSLHDALLSEGEVVLCQPEPI